MRHRQWFLIAAGGWALYAFVLIRLPLFTSLLPIYGDSDIYAGTALASVLILCWLALEVSNLVVSSRPLRCGGCGYDLSGVKCPECGRPARAASEKRP